VAATFDLDDELTIDENPWRGRVISLAILLLVVAFSAAAVYYFFFREDATVARATEDEAELEEERRLMYVAMTRARNHLAVSYPLNVYDTRRGADYSLDQVSRFLDRGVRRCFQSVTLEAATESATSEASTTAPEVDVRQLLKNRFAPPA